jgi:hypothetical protein
MTDTSKLLSVLMRELNREPAVNPCPPGWFTIEQIRQELRLSHTRNASSRAADLCKRGVLERMSHQFKAETGQCHKAYVYRPVSPFKTITEAAENLHVYKSEPVPKGFVRIVDYAATQEVSAVAIRGRVERACLKPTYFKTARGLSGLHRNAFYKKSDLDRLRPKR